MGTWNTINLSYVITKKRIDSKFYKKEDVDLETRLIKICSNCKLKKVAYEIQERFDKKSITTFQYNDIGNTNLINGSISENIIKSSEAPNRAVFVNKLDDILISSVRPNRNANAIINSRKIIQVGSNGFCNIRSKHIDPNYIYIYTKTKFFISTLVRVTTSTMYPAVSNKNILDVPFFIPKEKEVADISNQVKTARKDLHKSEIFYRQATEFLENKLRFKDLKKNQKKIRITQLTELSNSKRIDAQFFKSEFLQYESFIRKNNKFNKLSDVLEGNLKGKQQFINSKGNKPYVSIKDISGIDIIAKGNVIKSLSQAIKEDLLLAVTGATIGKIGIVYRYPKISFCGDLLGLHVNKSKISPWYVLAILNSPIGQTQFNKWITGSTNGHLRSADIGQIIIPRFDKSTEKDIGNLLKQSLFFSIRAETLLNKAKLKVEELIEQTI